MLALLLSACSSSNEVDWRGLSLTPPEGWQVFEQRATTLSLANGDLSAEGVRGQRAVAMQFNHEPRTVPDDWRELVTSSGGTIEVDESFDLDGVPSTRLVFSWVTGGIPTREMVVLIPSRGIVVLAQPVVEQGETDGPDRFLEFREQFDAVLDSIVFGAPVDR